MPTETTRPFASSVQMTCEGWILHYAWIYHAISFSDAVDQAMEHFYATQRGELLSINMTDGVDVLVYRKGLDGVMITQMVSTAKRDLVPPLIGPDTLRSRE